MAHQQPEVRARALGSARPAASAHPTHLLLTWLLDNRLPAPDIHHLVFASRVPQMPHMDGIVLCEL